MKLYGYQFLHFRINFSLIVQKKFLKNQEQIQHIRKLETVYTWTSLQKYITCELKIKFQRVKKIAFRKLDTHAKFHVKINSDNFEHFAYSSVSMQKQKN